MIFSRRRNSLIILFFVIAFPFLCLGKGTERIDTISARRAFVELGADMLDLLSKNDRLDMLDYYDADSIVSVTNRLQGKSRLEKVTPEFLEVSLTPVSTLQIKILTLKNGSRIVMTLYTVGAPGEAQETDMRFFDAGLSPLPASKYMQTLKFSDFFDIPKGSLTSMKELEGMLPFYTVVIQAAPVADTLKARLTLGDVVSMEDANLLRLFMRPEVTLVWRDNKWKLNK